MASKYKKASRHWCEKRRQFKAQMNTGLDIQAKNKRPDNTLGDRIRNFLRGRR